MQNVSQQLILNDSKFLAKKVIELYRERMNNKTKKGGKKKGTEKKKKAMHTSATQNATRQQSVLLRKAMLKDVEIEDFCDSKILVDHLKAFIAARKFSTSKKPKEYGKWPMKGSLEDAEKGMDCLVL